MITFRFMPKSEKNSFLPVLFDMLYSNMKTVAPSGKSYEEDKREFLSEVGQGLEKEQRQIILIYDVERLIGFFMYYVNDSLFMMEEIQFLKKYQGTGVFGKLYGFLYSVVPKDVGIVEAFAHKTNVKSQAILLHLGLVPVGENSDGSCLRFRGDCGKMMERYGKEKEK